MPEMKTYIGVKIVKATPLTRGDYNKYRGWEIPADEDPKDEGYLVVYPDSYESWSPKKQFEEANRLADGMPFSHALEAMNKGHKVARVDWPEGMTIMKSGDAIVRFQTDIPTVFYGINDGFSDDLFADDWKIVD